MAIFKLAALGTAAYALYRYASQRQPRLAPVAFAPGETNGDNFAKVRNAGPDGMRSNPSQWDSVDQASDESFPASDPPGTY